VSVSNTCIRPYLRLLQLNFFQFSLQLQHPYRLRVLPYASTICAINYNISYLCIQLNIIIVICSLISAKYHLTIEAYIILS
jgi:hypothetical protein